MTTKNRTTHRQGDVLVERVSKTPATLTEIPREAGRIVLAHGEATGHAHALDAPDVRLVADSNGGRFLLLNECAHPDLVGGGTIGGKVVEPLDALVRFQREDGTFIRFQKDDIEVGAGGVKVVADLALLRHEEHDAHALRTGHAYRVTRQREYSPESVRTVAD